MTKLSLRLLTLILTFSLSSIVLIAKERTQDCNYTTNGKTYSGKCSFYSAKLHGNRTTSGERYDKDKFTAAHRTLPFGTKVKVTDKRTGKSTIVKINDRGLFTAKVEVLKKANQN
jgi:rare lipoprotein A